MRNCLVESSNQCSLQAMTYIQDAQRPSSERPLNFYVIHALQDPSKKWPRVEVGLQFAAHSSLVFMIKFFSSMFQGLLRSLWGFIFWLLFSWQLSVWSPHKSFKLFVWRCIHKWGISNFPSFHTEYVKDQTPLLTAQACGKLKPILHSYLPNILSCSSRAYYLICSSVEPPVRMKIPSQSTVQGKLANVGQSWILLPLSCHYIDRCKNVWEPNIETTIFCRKLSKHSVLNIDLWN